MNDTAHQIGRRRAAAARCLAALALAGLLVLSPAVATRAQEETLQSTHDDWLVKCGKPPGSKERICWVEQKVTSEDRPNVGLTVTYLKAAKKGDEGTLQVQAPLGVILPRHLGLKIDGKDVGNVPFLRCFASGCLARAQVPADLLNALQSGTTAVFIIFDTPEAGIGIPISLKGFSQAVAALK